VNVRVVVEVMPTTWLAMRESADRMNGGDRVYSMYSSRIQGASEQTDGREEKESILKD
jgi:hypothetical protein